MLIGSNPLAATAHELRSGHLHLIEYVTQILDRIDRVDPQIHALLPESGRRKRLLKEAEARQHAFPEPGSRPPLYGILFGVKDIFHAGGFPTRAGSNLPEDLFVGAEANVVARLEQAGAMVLGKTVTTEFAYFEPGPTRNPHNLEHTPGGSSSGSAAAVAAGFCSLALGTQTVGSTIRPAAFCGIVGFKPSYGRIDRAGLLLVSDSLDHVGLFTQDVAGMALAASILLHTWESDETDRRPVLGIPEGAYLLQASTEGLQAFEAQVERLKADGYQIKHIPALDDIATIADYHVDLMAAEVAQIHQQWFAEYAAMYRPRTAELIRRGQTVNAQKVTAARNLQVDVRAQLHTLMRDHHIDLWICPAATGTAPEGIGATGDPAMNLPWTFSGLPAIALPAGKGSNGLPLGLQVVAPHMMDERLLHWANRLSQALS